MSSKPTPTDPPKWFYVAHEDDDIQEYKKPWVGLTDDEIGQLAATHLFQNVWPHSTFAAIHAIEVKLKEKNA